VLATLLRTAGFVADFTPISSFIDAAPPADVCVVVSQRLSPNALVPLARAGAYRHVLLVTTVDEEDLERVAPHARSVHLLKHGPREEGGLLLRLIGPAAATAMILRLASHVTIENRGAQPPISIDAQALDVENALATSRERAERAMVGIDPRALFDVVGLVAVGTDVALCDGLRHKLLEGLGRAHPPLWDLCQLVHGPLQSFYDRTATLVLLEREPNPNLMNRLTRVLHPERHHVVSLHSALPGPLALVDFDHQLDHLVLRALRAAPRDLIEWPGKGRDAPLYDLGKESPEREI
jgi:hypothetical protein